MNKNNYFNVLLVLYASLAMIMATCVICINKDENDPIGWYAGISIGMVLSSCITICLSIWATKNKEIKKTGETEKEPEDSIKELKKELGKIKNDLDSLRQSQNVIDKDKLMEHEERMAIIKALGKAYTPKNEKTIRNNLYQNIVEDDSNNTALGKTCPSCHKPVGDGCEFCSHCGHKL